MTQRHLHPVTPDRLQSLAVQHDANIEIDITNERAYVRVDNVTYVAELAQEQCS